MKLGFEPRSFKVRSPSSFHYTMLDELMQKGGEREKEREKKGKEEKGRLDPEDEIKKNPK